MNGFLLLTDTEDTMNTNDTHSAGHTINRRHLLAGIAGTTALAASVATRPNLMAAPSVTPREWIMAQDASPEAVAGDNLGRFYGILVGVGAPPTQGGRCPVLTAEFEAPGLATHLGRFTTSQNHCMDPDGADPLAFTNGEYTFTGEDGSSISGRYSGRLLPTETTDVDNMFLIQGRFTIESGAGRLEGATGGGPADGIMNMTTGEMSLYLGGAIAYPNPGAGVESLPDALPLKTKAW
jgi:hypothetical protein